MDNNERTLYAEVDQRIWQASCPACRGECAVVMPAGYMPTYCVWCGETADYNLLAPSERNYVAQEVAGVKS